MKKRFLSSHFSFFLALVIGLALAVGASVWATSIGTNISGTGTLSTTGATTLNGAVTIGDAAGDAFTINSATSTITAASVTAFGIATSSADIAFLRFDTSNWRLGMGTTTPAVTLSIGGAGNIYALGGIGAGTATTTAGALETSARALIGGALNVTGNFSLAGSAVLGDVAGDTLTINAASVTHGNAGTTTIVSSSGPGWAIATSSADIAFMRFNTSNSRIGINTTTPLTTLTVGGSGDVYLSGGLGVGQATTSAGVIENTGNVLFGDAAGDKIMFNSAFLIHNNAGTTTIPAADALSWSIATSSASGAPFVRYDTSSHRIGISTTTPGATLSVGGAGNIYAIGGLGVGQATTSAGVIENTGNALFGDAATDKVMLNAASLVFNNAGTTTIPAATGPAWSVATTTANVPLLVYNTSNSRVGINTTTPLTTLTVGGAGNVYMSGGLGVGQATTTAGIIETSSGPSLFGGDAFVVGSSGTTTLRVESTANGRGGCIQIESPGALAGAGSYFHMYATTTGWALWQTGPCK